MAQGATIYKVDLSVADMDRNYFADHRLTVARHPSENDERLMTRILAFSLHASDDMVFTKGLCVEDEPDLWEVAPNGDIKCWIDLGMPSEKRLRKACGRADNVFIYCYGQRKAESWWQKTKAVATASPNLSVYFIEDESCRQMAQHCVRKMEISTTVQEGQIYLSINGSSLNVTRQTW